MQKLQAFKYELMPNGEQLRNMRRFAGACQFVFNQGLALQKARKKKLSYAKFVQNPHRMAQQQRHTMADRRTHPYPAANAQDWLARA